MRDFEILEEQKDYYLHLGLYFGKHRACRWDLNKGLLICGDIGTGKSLSMQLMQQLYRGFRIINTRYVIREYMSNKIPVTVLDMYGRKSFSQDSNGSSNYGRPLNYCLDDLGLENIDVKNYGNQQNVLEEILIDRYDMFVAHGMKTYATTNLNAEMIENFYGKRVRDRMRQMMNYVELKGNSKRK